MPSIKGLKNEMPAGNWCDAPDPVDIHLYVLELEGGRYYVGLTGDVAVRFSRHANGDGADWTRLHKPIRIVRSVNTGTRNSQEAVKIEDMVTVELMRQHGIDRVRGGCYAYCDQGVVESLLRSHGHWQSIKAMHYSTAESAADSKWDVEIQCFINAARAYYCNGCPEGSAEHVFQSLFNLTKYRFWRDGFEPCLDWKFWGKKGVLKTLLSFKENTPIGFKYKYPWDVLALALNNPPSHPLPRLALIAWDAYCPEITANQEKSLVKKREMFCSSLDADRKYDEFVSVLLPELRSRLING